MTALWGRYGVRGIFWRRFLRWGVLNCPLWFEPPAIAIWATLFMFWGAGRRALLVNLKAIKPRSWTLTNYFRAQRVFYNFAWTIADTMRFRELNVVPDWEFDGLEHFQELCRRQGGAIIITAHLGSYDLGADLFSRTSERRLFMVRAPEIDPSTREFEQQLRQRTATEKLRVDFSTRSSDLALELLQAVQSGEIVAIQGDRVIPGVGTVRSHLFGKSAELPAGPFALALATRAPLYPLFITRVGRRRYRLVARPPITVERRSPSRDESIRDAVGTWTRELEQVVAHSWFQWFAFEPFPVERAA